MDKLRKQILVTDDDPGVRESFHMALKDEYDILTADTGDECIRIIKQKNPALVILDVLLPDANGISILKKIRLVNMALPVIVITGAGTHRMALEALKLGADDFLAKPLNFHYVKKAVAVSLDSERKQASCLPTSEDMITKNYLSNLIMLNKILEARDPYTGEHSKRVGEYAVKIARALGLSQDEQEIVWQTALLHDIGKVGVTEVVLHKPDKLNAQEWSEIRRHALIGEEFLEPLKMLHIEQSIVRHHHERYDGKGYPDHLKGEEIPIYARILAIADSYEAMTSERPYRHALNPIEAITELERCCGTQFDSEIVKVFVKIMREENLKKEA